MVTRYVTDMIADEYLSWQKGDSIFIATPTGSGKSTFILKRLLPHAIKLRKKIVYLCNRKTLNNQLLVESHRYLKTLLSTSELTQEECGSIFITTYQHCEEAKEYPYFVVNSERLSPDDILYYVFDEAHYFLADAPFNTNTNYWYDKNFSQSISIFLSATPEPLFCFLESFVGCSFKLDLVVKEIRSNDFDRAFRFISSAAEQIACNQQYHFYHENIDYSYIHPHYFNKLCDLTPLIANSSDKWIIFTNNKETGNELLGRLNERGCSAVYLSAQAKKQKGSDSYKEFLNIAENQRFDCQVLIATSVLDCGVSIVDQKVKNIVVCSTDKDEFLQMIGRRRIRPDESINLYIKYCKPGTVNSFCSKCRNQLMFCAQFSQINDITYEKVGHYTANWDGMRPRSTLTARDRNDLVKQTPKFHRLIYNKKQMAFPDRGAYSKLTAPANDIQLLLEEYEVSRSAFVSLIYRYKNYREAIDEHMETKDPLFYLKRQLSWIEKQYDPNDPSAWVGYDEVFSSFSDFLRDYSLKSEGIPQNEQENFCLKCLDYLLKIPMPLETLSKDISRYKKGSAYPKKKKNKRCVTGIKAILQNCLQASLNRRS